MCETQDTGKLWEVSQLGLAELPRKDIGNSVPSLGTWQDSHMGQIVGDIGRSQASVFTEP